MTWGRPYGQLTDDVSFLWQGRVHSPGQACTFDDHCTPQDYRAWRRRAAEWIDVLRRVDTDRAEQLASRFAAITGRSDDCRTDCESATRALVSLSQLAAAVIDASGKTVTAPPYDWGRKPPSLPLPRSFIEWVEGIGDDVEEGAKKLLWQKMLPWLAVGALIYFSQKGGRRRG